MTVGFALSFIGGSDRSSLWSVFPPVLLFFSPPGLSKMAVCSPYHQCLWPHWGELLALLWPRGRNFFLEAQR